MINKSLSLGSLDMSDELVFFSHEKTNLLDQYSVSFETHVFHDYVEWKKERILSPVVIITGSDPNYIAAILDKIRRDEDLFASLCFVTESVPASYSSLVDGQLPQPPQLKQIINQFLDLFSAYNNSEVHISHLGRLIKYLWLRPNFILHPYQEWQHVRLYRYPLLEALSQDKSDSFEWLQSLSASKLLEPVALIDRQRECAFCHSSHLSFIDICPGCHAIDIELQASLHCFTCGCVDVQEKFIHSGALICPKCNTQLRHIGSDYDRPIENHSCHVCHQTFVEPNVLARCTVCEKEMMPNDLASNRIRSWKLSDRGRIIAVRGEVFDIATSFDQLNFIPKDLFIHDLDWLLISSRRYPDITFSLFGIYFLNLIELIDLIGHTQLLQMLESFAQRLRSMLRTPDLSTRTAENMLWLLLPHTDAQGLSSFQKRIENSMQLLQAEGDMKLDCRFISVASSQILKSETAELLLARLYGELI
ncbi:diguanylate cyclase [Nitrosomonas sp.]|uniref:TackOD1 domain-containing metal-binding protein n=1 Tax=Nitrosomonas sp. TaxID=42353 RepID=UPI0025DEA8DC|nr:diguanylate cyclase [Nitrosomonas sp.]